MGNKKAGDPRCSRESAEKIVELLRSDEEARCRWNTLLGRGIGASMRETFLAYRNGRRGEYVHGGAAKRTARVDSCASSAVLAGVGPHFLAALSRARIVS